MPDPAEPPVALDASPSASAGAPDGPAAPAAPRFGADEQRVAETLARLRAGVRQRRSEATTLAGATAETHSRLLVLKEREYLQEPVPFSHRASLGRWIVLARKAFYHLFLKWMLRPVLANQNEFNQAAAGLLQELAQGQERQARQLAELAARLAALERGGVGGPDGTVDTARTES